MDTSPDPRQTGGPAVGTSQPPRRSSDEPASAGSEAAFGEFLRQARERRQLTLQQISSDTKIASRHLSALEQGNVGALPAGMYRRAMLRAYAESVGLDTQTALEHFERTFEQPFQKPQMPSGPTPPAAAPDARRTARPVRRDTRLALVVVVLAAIAVVALITGDADQPTVAAQQSAPAEGRMQTEGPAGGVGTPASSRASAADRGPAKADRPLTREVRRTAASVPSEPVPAGQAGVLSAPAVAAGAVSATTGNQEVSTERPATARAVAGQLVVRSEPAGARVTVNGMGWGLTPVTVRHLPFGAKRVRVTKDGYHSEERVIDLGPARPNTTVQVSLTARD